MSSNVPNVLVCTLECGEADFVASKRSIEAQTGVNLRHIVFSNLPEAQAHNSLWQVFRNASFGTEYSMFMKVDADTVLLHDRIIIDTYEMFNADKNVTSVQAPLHDYFTDCFINGLNSFSPRVKFKESCDSLYCDRVDYGHVLQLYERHLPKSLVPSGKHCHHANKRQAFHFGLHRALKGQVKTLNDVKKAWIKHNDDLRAWALLGAMHSHHFSDRKGLSYVDERFNSMYTFVETQFDELVHTL